MSFGVTGDRMDGDWAELREKVADAVREILPENVEFSVQLWEGPEADKVPKGEAPLVIVYRGTASCLPASLLYHLLKSLVANMEREMQKTLEAN